MAEKIKDVHPPRGLARLGWRAPIWLYRLGLGGLLGGRLVLINHIGRKTGQLRQAVVEVVQHNKESGAYVVASGFGEKADWYQNLMVHHEVTIQVGRKRMLARAERLPLLQATEVMLDYNRRHPAALRTLSGILGYRTDGSEADMRFFAGVIPIVALIPQSGSRSPSRSMAYTASTPK
jgi:deazaflavin-dependent oxidoreductase (nitroreductase family)